MQWTKTTKGYREPTKPPEPVTTRALSEDLVIELSKITGWTPRYQVVLICEFIDSIEKYEELSAFLHKKGRKDQC